MDESTRAGREIWQIADLQVDLGRQRVMRGELEVPLPRLSFDLFVALLRAAPNVLSNEDLMLRVWPGLVVSPETVVQRIKLLRTALGDDAAEPRYVRALRSRGYCLAAEPARVEAPPTLVVTLPVPSTSVDADPAGLVVPTVTPAAVPSHAPWRTRSVAIAAASLLLTALIWIVARMDAPTGTGAAVVVDASIQGDVASTVAVLPFKNLSAESGDAYLALSLPEMVMNRLASVRGLTVIARDSQSRMPAELTDAHAVGQRLNAGLLVDGSVQRQGEQLRVTARLIDAQAGKQLWSAVFERSVSQIFQLQDEIADQVMASLQSRLRGISAARPSAPLSANIDAYLAYLRGRAMIRRFTVAETEAAAEQYAQATRLDPMFAAAPAALYDARMQAAGLQYLPLDGLRRELRPLLDKALALNPADGAAWYARAMWEDSSSSEREADFRKAMLLDPGNTRGMVAFSEFLDFTDRAAEGGRVPGSGFDPSSRQATLGAGGERSMGRAEEAGRLLERALLIDPLSARVRFRQSMREARTGTRTGADASERAMREILEFDPEYYPALQRLAKYRWMYRSKPAEAIAIMERAIRDDPKNPWGPQTAAIFYLDLGEEAAARDLVNSTIVSRETARTVMAQYRGDWRAAGKAAMTPAAFEFGFHESWGVPEALRDYALATREYAQALQLLAKRFDIAVDGKPRVNLSNFRASIQVGHIQLHSGDAEHGRALLRAIIDWIDSPIAANWDKVYMRRARAQALMLLGQRDAALAELAASFLGDNDYTQWWYALDRDPVWQDVRSDARFVALREAVVARVSRERKELDELRARGDVPLRSGTVAR
jgi:TolB-like protein/DNA-binding winged helix-turn-helix (wHTH) protein